MTKTENNKETAQETKSEFSFKKMNKLYEEGKLKDHLDCKQYIAKFFFPTKAGTHVLVENGKIEIIQKETFKEVYLSRFPKDIQHWYKVKTEPVKLICDIHKPRFGKGFINVAEQLKHPEPKPYKEISKKLKDKIQILLDYIKLIWADNDLKVYEYILNWLAYMVRGNKNSSCIYAKGDEGIGKSTLPDFIRDYVLGKDLWAKGKSDHLKGQHNMQLLGKLFVTFEELQFFSEKEWRAIDSELKDMITDTMMSYTDKYEKRFQAESFLNSMVLTNVNSIRGANGRRYLVCDINPCKMNDFKYFDNIRVNCFNDEVGYAFYCFLCDRDVSKYDSFKIPTTKAKEDLCADLLLPIEKFLKFTFLLKNKPIDLKLKELFDLYDDFMCANGYSDVTPNGMTKALRELGINMQKNDKFNFYRVSIDDLEIIATRKKWRNNLDNDITEDIAKRGSLYKPNVKNDPYNKGVTQETFEVKHVLQSEHDELKSKYEELLKTLSKKKPKKAEKTEPVQEIVDTDSEDEKPIKKKKAKKSTLTSNEAISKAIKEVWHNE
jgi:hypothetical protein